MKKILNIISSVKGKESFSNKLSGAILEKLSSAYPGSTVQTRDLTKNPFPHLEESHFTAFYTPDEARTAEHREAIKNSDEAISELMDADNIVIGVPMYNFGIPSTLKSWIDHIVRGGVTFIYQEGGLPEGLVKNKKVYLAIASGGVFSEGPLKSYDFTESYLRTALGLIGLTDITVFRVEGHFRAETKETALPKALGIVEEYAY
ncbi:FMN-dependent NADH-azoreductase [Mucilaginibacter lappiensis]|uniref:FMN dependent NADH:quinone oxidoreductase n=1 Tax=Mucilaginibacter lappiensis TaxID=354630 RepID=A0ABR6PTK9_9SPHI|nr:NAD(P)H-dependent oxidoreductase [Mucilaginibacter lappiensis]MBB6111616.1 FMN-dependent NADH-azoreductase [Mucilaginibacter lappiensis]SIR84529.1 FMN-dependent NADH-azoreductase [Mucilaginibacter lappiensis]